MEYTEDSVDQASEDSPVGFKGKTPRQWQQHWHKELEHEGKRNDPWRKLADNVVKRYLDKRRDDGPNYLLNNAEFRINLFHTNTFTLMSFLYGSVPTADTSRTFEDANDDQARVAANILGRMLNTSIQGDGGDFTSVLRSDLEDWLVPGLGQARVRYEMSTRQVEQEAVISDETGETFAEASVEEILDYEDAVVEYVHWRDFRWGYGRIWPDVPWVGYNIYMTKEQAAKRFGPQKARLLTYERQIKESSEENVQNPETKDPQAKAKIVEIWSKDHLAVFWYSDGQDYILDAMPDPMGLPDFYTCPRPLVANASTTLFQPEPFFNMARDLYNEVDQLSTRINIITNACKVVGVYDASSPEVKRMLLETVENDLVPVENWAMAAEKGGVKGMVDFWPVDTVVEVLDKLRAQRLEAIELLNEVTGMSDILRGANANQYEAASKSQLRARFGSIRVQYMQEEFARFASDLLTIKAQVISKHFEPETIIEQSNIEYSYDAQYAQAGVALIKQPRAIPWRVEVKPETVAMVDWAQLKAERTEFLTAMATFLQSSAGILQTAPSAAPMLLEMMKWGLAGFKGGQNIESVVDAFIRQTDQALKQQQQNPKPSEEQMKVRGDLQKTQAKLFADLKKQADKHVKELQKLAAQTRADLVKTQADTQAVVIKEVVQADQNIREKRATQTPEKT